MTLDKHVLLVRVSGKAEDYGVYIGAVDGENYDKEAFGVILNGSSVWLGLASIFFDGVGKPSKWLFHSDPFNDQKWFDKQMKLVKPEGIEIPPEWTPNIIEIYPLDRHVLAVATSNARDRWGAYIGAVNGEDFDKEARGVVESGSEISFDLAEELFQDLGKGTRAGELRWHRDPQPEPIELDRETVARIRAGVRRQKEPLPGVSTDEDAAST